MTTPTPHGDHIPKASSSCVAGVAMMASHFEQAGIAIWPTNRTDDCTDKPFSLAIRFRPTASPAKDDFVCRNVFAGPARTSRPGLWRQDSQAGSFTPKLKALEHLLGALIGSEASRSPGHGQAFGSIIMNWTSAKLRVKRQGNRRSIRPRKPSTRLSARALHAALLPQPLDATGTPASTRFPGRRAGRTSAMNQIVV